MLNKRKPVFKIIMILTVLLTVGLLATGVLWFKQYYDYRYALEDYYYTVVPLDYDYTPARAYDSEDNYVGLEKEYNLVCYNADGKKRELEFKVFLDVQDLYPPGTYVRVSASKQWTIGKSALAESDVPEKALEKVKEHYAPSSASTLSEYADERTRQLSTWVSPATDVFCTLIETDLVYTYVYSSEAKELALSDVELLDPVYKSQFRPDKDTFPELEAISLIIKLEDGTEIFSQKYNERVMFSYEYEME